MNSIYGIVPSEQIQAQKHYFYKSIIACLYQKEENDPFLDAHIQTLINQIGGSNKLFNHQPEVLTIISCLETARAEPSQFRKAILDAANLVNVLKESDE
nr:MAG TPA: hypothetical protein [Caudoviricetes sp.]